MSFKKQYHILHVHTDSLFYILCVGQILKNATHYICEILHITYIIHKQCVPCLIPNNSILKLYIMVVNEPDKNFTPSQFPSYFISCESKQEIPVDKIAQHSPSNVSHQWEVGYLDYSRAHMAAVVTAGIFIHHIYFIGKKIHNILLQIDFTLKVKSICNKILCIILPLIFVFKH